MRGRIVGVLLVASLLAPIAVWAARQGPHQKATGGVGVDGALDDFRLEFNAHGTSPAKGQVHYRSATGAWFIGTVTQYLQPTSKEALFAGDITGSSSITDTRFVIGVEDNGEGANAPDDRVGLLTSSVAFDLDIDGPSLMVTLFLGAGTVTEGNLQVHK